MTQTGILLKIFAAAAMAMVALLGLATWLFFERPLALDAAFSRFALRQAGFTRRHLTGTNGDLTVFEGGKGPHLVLIHDAGEQAGSWARTVSPLLEDYRVVIPDLAGHGSSDPDRGPITVDMIVRGFSEVMVACCPDGDLTLVGNGLGAWVALQYALDNPERVARLVVVNGGPMAPDDTPVNLFPSNRNEARLMMDGLMGGDAAALPGHVLDDIVRRANTGPAARIDPTSGIPATVNRLDRITAPVTLIWGARDELYDLIYASRLLDRLHSASIITLEPCGHMPQRECPVEFVGVLRTALVETDSSTTEPDQADKKTMF